jgi:hypothetical protein
LELAIDWWGILWSRRLAEKEDCSLEIRVNVNNCLLGDKTFNSCAYPQNLSVL